MSSWISSAASQGTAGVEPATARVSVWTSASAAAASRFQAGPLIAESSATEHGGMEARQDELKEASKTLCRKLMGDITRGFILFIHNP